MSRFLIILYLLSFSIGLKAVSHKLEYQLIHITQPLREQPYVYVVGACHFKITNLPSGVKTIRSKDSLFTVSHILDSDSFMISVEKNFWQDDMADIIEQYRLAEYTFLEITAQNGKVLEWKLPVRFLPDVMISLECSTYSCNESIAFENDTIGIENIEKFRAFAQWDLPNYVRQRYRFRGHARAEVQFKGAKLQTLSCWNDTGDRSREFDFKECDYPYVDVLVELSERYMPMTDCFPRAGRVFFSKKQWTKIRFINPFFDKD